MTVKVISRSSELKLELKKNSTKWKFFRQITGTIAGTIVDQPVKAEELFDQSAPLGKKHALKKYDQFALNPSCL